MNQTLLFLCTLFRCAFSCRFSFARFLVFFYARVLGDLPPFFFFLYMIFHFLVLIILKIKCIHFQLNKYPPKTCLMIQKLTFFNSKIVTPGFLIKSPYFFIFSNRLAILKYLGLIIFLAASYWWKDLGICTEDFWIRAAFLLKVRY